MLKNNYLVISIALALTSPGAWSATNSTATEKPPLTEHNKKVASEEPASVEDIEKISVIGRSLGIQQASQLSTYVLSDEELVYRRQGGLGETLAGLPGVHLDNFGGGASRPVIRGQTVPRIEILTDGAKIFDVSSVSPDHAITADPLLLDAIEIQRGPAAVRYGGSAVNGAINLIDGKIPKELPSGGISGAGEIRYGSGNEEKTTVGRITAGLGDFAVHAEGSLHTSEDYDVPSDFGSDELKDSYSEGSNFAIGTSWIRNDGYIGIAYSRQESEYGLPGHSHANGVCHTHGIDLHCEAHGIYADAFLGMDDSHTAYIKLNNERIDIRADYKDLFQGIAQTRLRLSYTDYEHDEMDGDTQFASYANEVYDGLIELTHKPLLGFIGTFGIQYSEGTFSGLNLDNEHQGRTSHDLITKNVGVFLSEKRSFGALEIELAVRKDWQKIHADKLAYNEFWGLEDTEFPPEWIAMMENYYDDYFEGAYPTSKQKPFSASLGFTWQLGDGYSTGLVLNRSQRAPSVRELYANGNNLSTNSYEVGLASSSFVSETFPENSTDFVETTKSVDLVLKKTGGQVEFEVGIFYQNVDDYIFARLIEEEQVGDITHRYLLYTAADTTFAGIDGQISYHYSPTSRITLFGDYVDADLKAENDNLPRIPPGRLGVRYNYTEGLLSADVEYAKTFAQNDIALYESRTSSYNMLNFTVAYQLELSSGNDASVYLRGTNLTDELAYAHTSFVKDQSPLRGRNVVLGMRYSF